MQRRQHLEQFCLQGCRVMSRELKMNQRTGCSAGKEATRDEGMRGGWGYERKREQGAVLDALGGRRNRVWNVPTILLPNSPWGEVAQRPTASHLDERCMILHLVKRTGQPEIRSTLSHVVYTRGPAALPAQRRAASGAAGAGIWMGQPGAPRSGARAESLRVPAAQPFRARRLPPHSPPTSFSAPLCASVFTCQAVPSRPARPLRSIALDADGHELSRT
ncbi:hypothetical protein HETIRDRAFT_391434 [Heterobasidion irregulare TC 32-1]|uniref:Uncharacterized protein n=1 Tax=Heterobasidion irregulare (strain TC 32-1) TaxID=747525 RepID=W4JPF1_HETIT|nr:uncharacterized protein HETIRDRAFT_391434 [Heterobasidion irregulare TC 32-1]ETW74761.1 hypothetical protein HETIRDRAFT_391434 [Heterobasidion irregulare TC 32-1]